MNRTEHSEDASPKASIGNSPRQLRRALAWIREEVVRQAGNESLDDEAASHWRERLGDLVPDLLELRGLVRRSLHAEYSRVWDVLESLAPHDRREAIRFEVREDAAVAYWAGPEVTQPRGLLAHAIHQRLLASDSGTAPPRLEELDSLPSEADGPSVAESSVDEPLLLLDALDDEESEAYLDSPRPPAKPSVQLPGRSIRLDHIAAVVGRLARQGSFEDARDIALEWTRKKHLPVPKGSVEFKVQHRGNKAEAIGVPGVWALQVETADREIPGRVWRVELVLVDAPPCPAVSITLVAMSPAAAPVPEPSIPGLAQTLIAEIGIFDTAAGELVQAQPIEVASRAEVELLAARIASPRRTAPIVALSRYRKGEEVRTLMGAELLARRLIGIGHVAVLDAGMGQLLGKYLGTDYSVGGASVRLFRPGFQSSDGSEAHPCWNPTALKEQGLTLNDLQRQFMREGALASLRATESDESAPPFDHVREQVLRRQIAEVRSRPAVPLEDAVAQSERIRDLERALGDAESLTQLYEDDNATLDAAKRQFESEVAKLKTRVYQLENRLRALESSGAEDTESTEPPFPESWNELEGWSKQHLRDRVVLTPKAIRAARSSSFDDPSFAYRVLWYLADVYVPCRRGEYADGRTRLEEAENSLGIEMSGTGRAAEDHRSRDTYSVMYKDNRVALDMHVKGSSHRDRRKGFRLYFHWAEADKVVVVGHFPEHLDNALT